MNNNMKNITEDVKEGIRGFLGIQPEISVICIGGGANNIGSQIYEKNIPGVRVISLNTDKRVSQNTQSHLSIIMGKDIIRDNVDAGGFEKIGESVISQIKSNLINECKNSDVIIPIAVLGGGTGTGGLRELVRMLNDDENGIKSMVIPIAIKPFSAEKSRRQKAEKFAEEIKQIMQTTKILDNDEMLKYGQMNFLNAFSNLNNKIIRYLQNISEMTFKILRDTFEYEYLKNTEGIIKEIAMEKVEGTGNPLIPIPAA